jgi:hypothetical protein
MAMTSDSFKWEVDFPFALAAELPAVFVGCLKLPYIEVLAAGWRL